MPRKKPLNALETEILNGLKLQLCEAIDVCIQRHQINYHHAAQLCRTSKTTISCIVNKRTERLSLNQLFEHLVRLRPQFKCLVAI